MCRREGYAHNAKEMKQIGGTVFELATLVFECELVLGLTRWSKNKGQKRVRINCRTFSDVHKRSRRSQNMHKI